MRDYVATVPAWKSDRNSPVYTTQDGLRRMLGRPWKTLIRGPGRRRFLEAFRDPPCTSDAPFYYFTLHFFFLCCHFRA